MYKSCYIAFKLTFLLTGLFVFRQSPLAGQEVTSDTVAYERQNDFQSMVLHDRLGADRWWYGWLTGYSAATAGQVIVSLTTDNTTLRQDMALGAATTLLGAVGQLIAPIVPYKNSPDYPSYKEYVSGDKTMSSEQAAELLKILARREKEGRSWKMHALAGVVNIGSGLVTWLGYKRTFLDGLENFAINTVITEAQIWTQPTRAIRDYEKYCRRLEQGTGTALLKPESEWKISVYAGGFAVRLDF